ncbi:unnamed protein product [Symbiodinium pilosum]|uniref:BTB domain-containing protein n=1 Tax=Symbiodinium pilosum TaxID=2952 RepID=A0A812SAI5_SYMPI|nr:unnamed protein product [Symbiodinium pilosum]
MCTPNQLHFSGSHTEVTQRSRLLLRCWMRCTSRRRQTPLYLEKSKKYLEDVVAVLACIGPPKEQTEVVPQSTMNLWESMRHMTSTHKVVFETSDGEVSVHDHILMLASPVLKAMLESTMQEGTRKRIEIKDSTASSASLFLDLLYTSSTREDPDYQATLGALDLAHRWQVHGMVPCAVSTLREMITVGSFAEIAEA